MATDRQVDAFRAAVPRFYASAVRRAIDAADGALEQGQPPVQAVTAAAVKLNPEVLTLSGQDRNLLMVDTLNGLMRADRVVQLGPYGIFPLQRAVMGEG